MEKLRLEEVVVVTILLLEPATGTRRVADRGARFTALPPGRILRHAVLGISSKISEEKISAPWLARSLRVCTDKKKIA